VIASRSRRILSSLSGSQSVISVKENIADYVVGAESRGLTSTKSEEIAVIVQVNHIIFKSQYYSNYSRDLPASQVIHLRLERHTIMVEQNWRCSGLQEAKPSVMENH